MFSSTPTVTPERLVDRAHPFGVAAGQVVVDGHHVNALAPRLASGASGPGCDGQRVQHHRQRRRQRLALAGLHLGDLALVQRHAADQLDVEVAHPHRALAGLATIAKHSGSRSSSDSPSRGALAQLVHALAQLVVGVVFELGLEGVDQRDALLVDLELLRLADVQRAVQQGWHAAKDSSRRGHARIARSAACRRVLRQRPGCDDRACRSSRAAGLPGRSPARPHGGRVGLTAVAEFVAVALHLAGELVHHQVQRVEHLGRGVTGAEGDALQVQRPLGHLAVGDARVGLLEDLDLESREL